ncbi:acyltransferase [Staphylococcus massiliensis]|nr:acyltransferase [Staphylococcus massiliensis]MCG3400375.1 acyltransferase [Staphylococcus massiliensis]MCG3401778.1 acyltransferase [Staphylococcus massiliensis]MCG3412650.1 acyltransferase [Staphylococcus massiliensis]POA01511.1 acyltransferase [Staphylococcus massiliensis CCUG 55927]
MYRFIKFGKILKNTVVIEACRYLPSVRLKRTLFIKLLGMKIGEETAIAFKAVPDIMYPELIAIGKRSVIGYNATILTHEFLVDEFRKGNVQIGDYTLIGANVTILPGVTIGNYAKVGAGTVVTKNVPDHALAYGNPMQLK